MLSLTSRFKISQYTKKKKKTITRLDDACLSLLSHYPKKQLNAQRPRKMHMFMAPKKVYASNMVTEGDKSLRLNNGN